MDIAFLLNGETVQVAADPTRSLLDWLRGQFEQRRIALHQDVNPVDVDKRVAMNPWHLRVDFRDHGADRRRGGS